MTRAEYMEGLAKALKDYDEDFALDIIGDYRRHFDEAAADGRSEESVCEELGSVEDFINGIYRRSLKETVSQMRRSRTMLNFLRKPEKRHIQQKRMMYHGRL